MGLLAIIIMYDGYVLVYGVFYICFEDKLMNKVCLTDLLKYILIRRRIIILFQLSCSDQTSLYISFNG